MPKIGPLELIIILVIVLVVFGVGRLPQVGGAIGKSLRAFKRGVEGKEEEATEKEATSSSNELSEENQYTEEEDFNFFVNAKLNYTIMQD